MKLNKKISVFCASSSKVNKDFLDAAGELAQLLIAQNCLIQYGGGRAGLMGKIADAALAGNGSIKGIIPKFMIDEGWVHPGIEDMVVVADMQERKHMIMSDTDAIIALPGGVGTLEELTEAITLKQLGLINVPIVILNINRFYDPLLELFEKMVDENLLRMEHQKLWQAVTQVSEVIPAINNAFLWDSGNARNIAAI